MISCFIARFSGLVIFISDLWWWVWCEQVRLVWLRSEDCKSCGSDWRKNVREIFERRLNEKLCKLNFSCDSKNSQALKDISGPCRFVGDRKSDFWKSELWCEISYLQMEPWDPWGNFNIFKEICPLMWNLTFAKSYLWCDCSHLQMELWEPRDSFHIFEVLIYCEGFQNLTSDVSESCRVYSGIALWCDISHSQMKIFNIS